MHFENTQPFWNVHTWCFYVSYVIITTEKQKEKWSVGNIGNDCWETAQKTELPEVAYVASGAHFNAVRNRVRTRASPAVRGLGSEDRGCCVRAGTQTWAKRMSRGTIRQVWEMGREDPFSVLYFQVAQGVRKKTGRNGRQEENGRARN